MFIYCQSTGNLWDHSGEKLSRGYSGIGEGKNNPKAESWRNVGPIPRGLWKIGDKYHSDYLGPHAIILEPDGHNAHGRTAFRIHGDSKRRPGEASNGCIVLRRSIRELISSSEDRQLLVIE